MNALIQYQTYAETALASYAEIMSLGTGVNKAELTSAGMSESQAASFDSHWAVVAQSAEGDPSGFSAVLLQSVQSGQKVLAIRGTDDAPDYVTDFVDIFAGQLRDMPQYIALEAFHQQLVSTGKLTSTEPIIVTGHSLGGFLAQAFTANHADVVSAAYTYNAPGFGGAIQQLVEFFGITDATNANSKIINLHATDGTSMTAGLGVMLGSVQQVHIEVGSAIQNHSIIALTDALAVQAAYAQLQPSVSTAQAGALFVASGLGERRLEDALDALRRSVLGLSAARTATGDRDAVYTGLKALSDSAAFESLSGQVRLSPVGANLGVQARARVDFQSLVAMQTLSPFVIDPAGDGGQSALTALWQSPAWSSTYAAWQADQASIAAGGEPLNFTDRYLLDRAGLLVKLAELNTKNLDPLLAATTAWQGRNLLFLDADSGARVAAGALPSPATAYDVVAFGKYSDDVAGELSGGAGNDVLMGGRGADILVRGAGDGLWTHGEQDVIGATGHDLISTRGPIWHAPLGRRRRAATAVWRNLL